MSKMKDDKGKGKGKGKASPEPPTIIYEKMPKSHKKKLYLHGTCKSYSAVINWLRTMCCLEGGVFKGIPSLDCVGGYPLVEIKVIVEKKKSTKFLIRRKDLYLIAFNALQKASTKKVWFQFMKCSDKVDVCERMTASDGSYGNESSPWERIGREFMKGAVHNLNNERTTQDGLVKACHAFFVHLCEAARFHPVEFVVYMSLGGYFNEEGFEWVENAERKSFDERMSESEEDVENHPLNIGPITDFYSQNYGADEFNKDKRSYYLEKLIHNYRQLSDIWYIYSLSNKKAFGITNNERTDYYINCIRNMRSTLAVLCCLNAERIKSSCNWKTKKKEITDDDLKTIEANIAKALKKV